MRRSLCNRVHAKTKGKKRRIRKHVFDKDHGAYLGLLTSFGFNDIFVVSSEPSRWSADDRKTATVIDAADPVKKEKIKNIIDANTGSSIVLVDKASRKGAYLNVYSEAFDGFIEKARLYSEIDLTEQGKIKTTCEKTITLRRGNEDGSFDVYRARPTSGDLGCGTQGEIFERTLFTQLYAASLCRSRSTAERKAPFICAEETKLIEKAKSLSRDENFLKAALRTYDSLIRFVSTEMINGLPTDSTRVYFTARNYSAGRTLVKSFAEMVSSSNRAAQKFMGKADESLLTANGSERVVNSVNSMKKADVVIAFDVADGGVVYVPISTKLSEEEGTGGERCTTVWNDYLGIKPCHSNRSLDETLFRLNKLGIKSTADKKALNAIVQDYVGDIGMIYAFLDSPVLQPSTKIEFSFKIPRKANVVSVGFFKNMNKEKQNRSFSRIVLRDKSGGELVFSDASRSSSKHYSLKLAMKSFNKMFSG